MVTSVCVCARARFVSDVFVCVFVYVDVWVWVWGWVHSVTKKKGVAQGKDKCNSTYPCMINRFFRFIEPPAVVTTGVSQFTEGLDVNFLGPGHGSELFQPP